MLLSSLHCLTLILWNLLLICKLRLPALTRFTKAVELSTSLPVSMLLQLLQLLYWPVFLHTLTKPCCATISCLSCTSQLCCLILSPAICASSCWCDIVSSWLQVAGDLAFSSTALATAQETFTGLAGLYRPLQRVLPPPPPPPPLCISHPLANHTL